MRSLRLRCWPIMLPLAAALSAAAAENVDPNIGRNLAATCVNCHGDGDRTAGGIPSLTGRSRASLLQTLQEFKDGKRASTVMTQLAKGYSDAQLDAIAAYYATKK